MLRLLVAALLGTVVLLVVPARTSWSEPDDESVADSVRAAVGPYLEEYNMPGAAVTVTRGTDVLYAGGLGADGEGSPVTADTRMRIASLSKSFTALAVLLLAEQGRLDLDDPVVEYLPELHLDDPRAARITIRQLLDHSSGLADRTLPNEYAAVLVATLAILAAGCAVTTVARGVHWSQLRHVEERP